LKAELEARRRDAEGLEERVEVLLKDCRELGDEVDGFRREKADVIRDLGLQDIAEYVTMFRRVQAELGDSLREVARLESLTKHLERDKSSYKARIVEDSQLIADLNDELARVKGVCHTLRLSTSFFSLDSSA
jgi:chromosome segregation ATPase